MKYLVNFFVIILLTFCITLSKADTLSIVYINIEKVINESNAGKYLVEQLEKIHKNNLKEFKKNEDFLKNLESSILSQKNILSSEEYNKKINSLSRKLNDYKKERKTKIDSVSKKKIVATSSLLKEINPILAEFSKKNEISIILKKKDIVIARTDLDITNEIIKLVNLKVKKFNLD